MCIFCPQNYVSKILPSYNSLKAHLFLIVVSATIEEYFFKRLWDHLKIKEKLDSEVDNVFYSGLNDSWNSIKSICPLRKNITIKKQKKLE